MAQGTREYSTGTTVSPSIPLTATMASAKPTWANCGVPATTSPAAQTPFSPVRWYSSATTNPLSSTSTATPAVTSPSVRGRRPTDTTMSSTSNVCSPARTTVALTSVDGAGPSA